MSRKLTKELILSRLPTDNLDSIKTLNLWSNNLEDISIIAEMPSLEVISLNGNNIKDIKALKNLKNLKELYLQDNKISDFNQIEFLKNCKKLEILNLSENPISQQQNYKQKILSILPNLKKLDDLENINNNFQHSKFPFHQNPFMLFKKIFPKRSNKIINNQKNELNLNASVNMEKLEMQRNTVNNKNDILNKSFQKKKHLGIFKKIGNNNSKQFEANKNLNLDFKYENIDPNKSTCFEDYHSNDVEMNMIRNKYNKKVVGNYPKLSHVKNYKSTMKSYQEFDEPLKNEKLEKKEKNSNDNDKNKKKEETVIQSIKLLLNILNTAELNAVNKEIQNILKEKNV